MSNFGDKLKGKTFCFTGAIQRCDGDGKRFTRPMMHSLVRKNGGYTSDQVGAWSTDYLVVADPKSNSGKVRKARNTKGVKIISEDEFFRMSIPDHILDWMDRIKADSK